MRHIWRRLAFLLLTMLAATRAFVPATLAAGRATVAAKQAALKVTTSTRADFSLMCSIGNLFGGGGGGATRANSIFDFKVKDATGAEVDLSDYRDEKKAFLVVNVANPARLTAQNYAELATLYGKYSSQGLEILGFPCNQFGSQARNGPTSPDAHMHAFAKARGATYPIFAKIEVNGSGAIPLYKFLKQKQGGGLGIDAIKWNFTKFLCDGKGVPIKRYGPTTSPLSFERDIVALL
ncbi:unnamed protein product [Ascophyllum nodosum]